MRKNSCFLLCFCIFSSSAHHYVLTPPLPFGQIAHREAESLKRCQCHPQRVALSNPQGTSDFLRDDDAAEIIPLCQVGAKKFYKLSEKPLISMALGFPDGATMHLRGFDRLCYFRSKFDRFAPKGNIGVNSQLRCFHRCRFSIR